ncbi:hypothetical protein [Flavobacterium sp. GP15]|uniref:hypothetical protein n=1 Tax=Flavobacterium sp. GP15 TaxID=2758567 RepID=UPI00165D56DA|nr:hypothetical protein [Flavobacterium sp. GP15]
MENFSTESEIRSIDSVCEMYDIKHYTLNVDGSINVDGNVSFFAQELKQLPLKFSNVSGDFDCSSNKLTTLEGSPKHVGGNFDCQKNLLITLEHSPENVEGNFNCNDNQISSLKYCTTDVGGSLFFTGNELPKTFVESFSLLNDEEKRVFLRYQDYEDIWTDGFSIENCEDFIHGKDGIKEGLL